MIDRVSGAPQWHPPAAVPGSEPVFEPAFEDVPEPAAPRPAEPPLGAPGPPAGAADVAARYRSAAEAADDAAPARSEFWA